MSQSRLLSTKDINFKLNNSKSATAWEKLSKSAKFSTPLAKTNAMTDKLPSISGELKSSLTSLTKRIGRRIIEKKVPGLGDYLTQKIRRVDFGLGFIERRNKSLNEGNSEKAAFACSVAAQSAELGTKMFGYSYLSALSAGVSSTGPVGIASTVTLWGVGDYVVRSSAHTVGDLTQKACHKLYQEQSSVKSRIHSDKLIKRNF